MLEVEIKSGVVILMHDMFNLQRKEGCYNSCVCLCVCELILMLICKMTWLRVFFFRALKIIISWSGVFKIFNLILFLGVGSTEERQTKGSRKEEGNRTAVGSSSRREIHSAS